MTEDLAGIAWLSPLVSFATTFAMAAWLVRARISRLAMDQPNQRSLHTSPVPRTGGVALWVGLLAGLLLTLANLTPGVWIGIAALLTVGLLDDIRGVSARWRMLVHVVAAMVAMVPMVFPTWGFPLTLLVVFATVWMTNLYNFMDGSDGLSGGMALFGFGFYGLAGLMVGDAAMALASFVVSAAAAAFLFFNFHPARIFMGDAGSIPLGFLASAFGILGWIKGYWPLWFPVLVFSPFMADASMTLSRRLLRGDKVWRAHKEHYYQRLVQLGLGHRNTALLEYALMICVGGSSLWALSLPSEQHWGLIGFWAAVYAGFGYLIDQAWRRYQR